MYNPGLSVATSACWKVKVTLKTSGFPLLIGMEVLGTQRRLFWHNFTAWGFGGLPICLPRYADVAIGKRVVGFTPDRRQVLLGPQTVLAIEFIVELEKKGGQP